MKRDAASGLRNAAFAIVMMSVVAMANAASHTAPYDSTLRLDYVFSGIANPRISLAGASKSAGWYGRRHNMDRAPYNARGMVTMTDAVTGDTLFVNAFSSLYLEWTETGDSVERAFQHTLTLPLPDRAADVRVTLADNRLNTFAEHRYTYSPHDILVGRKPAPGYDVTDIHTGSHKKPQINVAILPEGFTEAEMGRFDSLATVTVQQILSHDPFHRLADRFSFRAVHVPSRDSGVSVPRLGQWRDTAFGSHFSTFYSDRYLTTPNVFAIHDALTGTPYDHIIILANVDEYGGGGIYNSYTLTTTGHRNFHPVVVHEFGHSFGGLADEYFYEEDVMSDTYPVDIEPWEPNVTTLTDFGSKWAQLLAPGTPVPTPADSADQYPVGVYEGAAYSTHGLYRPADNCRMRTNHAKDFCPACREALRRLILFLTEEKH